MNTSSAPRRPLHFFAVALAFSVSFLPVSTLSAAALTWDANPTSTGQTDGSGSWLDANQWWNGTANASWNNATPDTATIGNGGTGGTITLGTGTTAGSLTFNAFSGTYLLGGGSLTLNSGGLTQNSGSGGVIISSAVTLGGAQTWTNNSSSLLSVKGTITTGGNALTIDGSGNTTLAGNNMIAGSGALIKNGSGALNLAGVNTSGTHTGGVTLNAGTLNFSSFGGGGTTGTRNLSSTVLGNGTFTINGGTFDNTSGFDLIVGHNNAQTWGGNFTFTGTKSLNMGNGAVTLTGNRTVTVNANNLAVGGVIGDGGNGFGFTKAGAGMLTVTGVNTFTGNVTVNAGILRATINAAALGTGAATLTLAGGELQLANSNANIAFNRNTTVTANSQITADTTVGFGANDSRVNTHTLGTLSIGAQTLTVASGANVLSNQNTTGNSGITFGATNLTGNATFNILNPTVAPAFRTTLGATNNLVTLLTLGAVTDNGNTATFTGSGNFAQTGVWGGGAGGITLGSGYTGTATLSQTNTFTGAVTINGGTLVANALANGGTASNLGASSNAASNLVLGGGTLQTSSAATIDRNFTLTDGTISTINNSAGLTMTGSAASSTGSLIKLGTGTLTLAGTNLYTGTTSVNAGNLTLGFSNALAPTNNILSSSSALALGGGTLTLTGKASTTNSQTFTGTTVNGGASTITATSGATGGIMNTALGSIARTSGQYGTVSFNRPTAGNITTSNTDTAAGAIIGAWATIGGTDYAAISGGNIVALAASNTAETAWTSNTGNYALGANQTLTASRDVNTLRASTGTLTLSLGGDGTAFDLTSTGILSGGGSTLTISRTGTATGVVRVGASTEAVFGGSQAISISAPLVIGNAGVLTKSTGNTLTLSGGVTTLGDATFVNNGSASSQFNLTTAALTLGGNLTLAGPTNIGLGAIFDINNGNRTIFANTTSAQTIAGTINNTGGSAGQKLTIGGSGLVTIGALTSGTNTPGLEINGTGVYTFGTASTFSGGGTLTAGTALLNNGTGLGTGTFTAKGGTITLNGTSTTYANALVFDGGNSTPINFTSSLEGFLRSMTFSGASTIQNAPTLNFTHASGNGTTTRTYSGAMNLNSNLTLTGTHTGNVLFTGGLTFGADRTITFNDSGNTTIRGALNGGTNILTLTGTNDRIFFGDATLGVSGTSGGVIVAGGLVQFGDFSGSSANTFSGGVTLTGGTIMLGKSTTGSVTSGPVGTGTLRLLGGSIGNLTDTGAATIANTLVLDGGNNTPISFINGNDGFSRAATYSGATTIQNDPTLNFTISSGDASNNGSRTFSGTKSLNSNLTLTGTHLASVFFTNGFDLSADRTITFNDDGVTSLAGNLSGTASTLTLAGSNTKTVIAGLTGATAHALTINGTANSLFTMTAASDYTGTTTVSGGTLAYGVSNAIATGAVTVNGSTAVLDLGTNRTDTVGTVTVDGGGKITGNGTSALTSTGTFEMKSGSVTAILAGSSIALNKTTSGTATLFGSNTYTGKTTVSDGTLQFAQMNALYAGTTASWTAANITAASGATVAMNVGGTGEFGATDLNTLITNISVASSSTTGLQSGAKIGLDTSNAAGGTFTQGNAIADSTGANGGAIGVTKLGTGTLVLDKSNTYTGATTISAGTLTLGSSGTIAGTSGVNLGTTFSLGTFDLTAKTSGFTLSSQGLSGVGTVNIGSATLTINDGTLAAGNSAGIIAITGNLALTGTTASAFELGTNTATSDQVNVSGAGAGNLTYGGALNVTFLGSTIEGTYSLFDFSGSQSGAFTSFSVVGTALTPVSTTGFSGSNIGGFDYSFAYSTGDLVIVAAAIPEPATCAAIFGMLALTCVAWKRRRSMRS